MSAEIAATELGRTGRRRAHWRWSLMALGVVVVVVGALIVWLRGGRVVSTDDAYVQAARSTISSNVTGQVSTILVKDNQRVHRGDVLFQLDDASFRIAVEEATAKIASAGLQMDAGRAAYQQQVALNGEITRQAAMIAYIDDFKLMTFVTVCALPLLFFIKVAARRDREAPHLAME